MLVFADEADCFKGHRIVYCRIESTICLSMEPPTETIVNTSTSSAEPDPKPADPKPANPKATRAKKNMLFSDAESKFLKDRSEAYFAKRTSLDAVRDEFVKIMDLPDTVDINVLREVSKSLVHRTSYLLYPQRIRKFYNNHKSYSRQKQNREVVEKVAPSGLQQSGTKAVALQAKRPCDPYFLNRDARNDIARYFEQMKEPETVHAFDIWCEKNKESLDDIIRNESDMQKASGNNNIGIRRSVYSREWRKVSADIKNAFDEEACMINKTKLAEFTRIRTPEEIEE